MENASKALIIAGAILISIVLVSVGVIVVNTLNPNDAVKSMDAQAVQAFNARFESYTGNRKVGSTVKQLITTIMSNNANADDDSTKIKVTFGSSSEVTTSTDLITVRNGINSATRYDVTPTLNNNSGLIELITITQSGN